MSRRFLRIWVLVLIVLTIIYPAQVAFPQSGTEDPPAPYEIYMPVLLGPPPFEIMDAWVGNTEGLPLKTHLPGASIQFIVTGINRGQADPVDLLWNQIGPCGTQVFTDTIGLDPDIWALSYPATAPDCLGQYTSTVQISTDIYTSSRMINYQINTAGVILSDKQGFDRCNIPSIEDMQIWWDSSPYYIVNVYLGGISYDNVSGCSNDNVDPNWIQTVADQGWSYLLAWVGLQAPCSSYVYRMSYDPAISYAEGSEEAEAALIAASSVGLPNSIIIHYDVEGYGNPTNVACRNAVASFLQGWTDRLHDLGSEVGAYGSPCNSHISDWADNNPTPDNVWIAHWSETFYDPFATVWDAPCLSNDLWPDHQRAKQYAGDHAEYWGGLRLRIDSNVLDGQVVSLGVTSTITTPAQLFQLQNDEDPKIQDIGLISPEHGWVLMENRMLLTQDGGAGWDDRTPPGITDILEVYFLNSLEGWLVYRDSLGLGLLQTSDGGVSWQSLPLPLLEDEFAAASLTFLDAQIGELTLKLPTSSTFNLVRKFFTQDGGHTWQSGGSIFLPIITDDVDAPIANPPEGIILVELADEQNAWVLAQQGTCQGDKYPEGKVVPPGTEPWRCKQQTQLWKTANGGLEWSEITP